MLIIKKKKLHIKFTINKLFIKSVWGCFCITLPFFFLYGILNLNNLYLKYDTIENYNLYFCFHDKIIGLLFRWVNELEFIGYGLKSFFDAKQFKYKIDLGFSHILEYTTPGTFFITRKLYGKRYILVVSLYKYKVQNFIYNLFKMRPYLKYKFRGFKLVHETLKLKIGKKKQFF